MGVTETFMYDLEVLRSKESQLVAICTDLSGISKTLKRINDYADTYWVGNASEEFKTRNIETMKRIDDVKESVNTAKTTLSQVIGIYSENEESNTGIVDSLSTDNIF